MVIHFVQGDTMNALRFGLKICKHTTSISCKIGLNDKQNNILYVFTMFTEFIQQVISKQNFFKSNRDSF